MADQDTNWTWNFSGPTTESKAQSRAILPKEIAWELTGVDGNEVGGLRTHPGFKSISSFELPTSHTLVNVFPINVLIDASNFVYGHIHFTTLSSTTYAYLQVTADGTTWYTSSSSIATWTGAANEITVKCMGKFTYIFVRGQDPKTLQITAADITTTNYSLWTGGPGTAPVVKVISTSTADGAADYADSTKNPAGSRNGTNGYYQDMHVYRAGGANSTSVSSYGTGATATCTVSSAHKINSVTITNSGTGYISIPTITITPTGGDTPSTPAVITATINYNVGLGPNNTASWHIETLTITNDGVGYNNVPIITIGNSADLVNGVGTPVKLKNGAYSFAVQYMSTTTGRKSVISNVQTLTIGVVPSNTTAAVSSEEYARLSVFNFGSTSEYNKALIYRTVKDAGEGGALHLEKTLTLPAVATITNVALTSNVATITTSAAHGYQVGDHVLVDASNNTFDGYYTVTAVPLTTTFTYAKTNTNITSVAATGTVTFQVRHYDVEVPDNQLVYLDVYVDKGIMDKTMPKGGVAGFMGSTLFVSRISGTDTAEPAGITPISPPRAVGDMRWSSTGEIQPENFKPSNRWIPQTPGNEVLGMQTVGNYMMAFSGDRVYRIGRAGQFIKVEEVHMGYGLAGVDAIEGVGGMVYFVSGGGMKAISAEGQIEDVAGLDALINRLWLTQKSELKMAYDAVGQCLTIMKPPTAFGTADGAAVCMWFGTNRLTELADLPFHYVRSGSHVVAGKLQRRAVFYKRNSGTSWGAYIVDHERLRGTGKNLCGGTAQIIAEGGGITYQTAEFDCAVYFIETGERSTTGQQGGAALNALSVAPILFRWVGGNVGSQADPGQPEFKDFFRQKQLSSCQTYFEVISVPTALPSTYATWRALAYKGTEETPFTTGVPTNSTGDVVSTFTTDANGSGLLHNAPFGRHGVMWSSLSVGFQCDIVGIDLRLMAFNSIGRVLDTTRRYV